MACVCSNRALPCLVPDIPRRTVPYDEMLTIDTSLEYEIEPSKFPGSSGSTYRTGSTDASERILQIGTRSAPTPDCTITHVSPGPLLPPLATKSASATITTTATANPANESDEALTQLIDELQADFDGGLLDVEDLLKSPSLVAPSSQLLEPGQRVPGSCGDPPGNPTRTGHTVSPHDQQPLGEYLDELRPIDNSPLLYGPNWNCLPPGQFTQQQQKHMETQKLVESLKHMEVQKHMAARKHLEAQKLLEAQSQLKAQQRLLEAHQKRMDAQAVQQRLRYPTVSTSQNAVPRFVNTTYAPTYRTGSDPRCTTMCPPVSTNTTSFLPVIENTQIMCQQQQQQQQQRRQQQQQQQMGVHSNPHYAPVRTRQSLHARYPMPVTGVKSTLPKYVAATTKVSASEACSSMTTPVAPNVTVHHPAFRSSGYCHVTPATGGGSGNGVSGNVSGQAVRHAQRTANDVHFPTAAGYNARCLQSKKRSASLMENIESSSMLDSIYMTYAQMNNSTKRVKTDVFTSTSPFQCYIRC